MINLDVDNLDLLHLDFHHLETLVHKLPNSRLFLEIAWFVGLVCSWLVSDNIMDTLTPFDMLYFTLYNYLVFRYLISPYYKFLTDQLQRSSSLKEQSVLDFSVHALSHCIDRVTCSFMSLHAFPYSSIFLCLSSLQDLCSASGEGGMVAFGLCDFSF